MMAGSFKLRYKSPKLIVHNQKLCNQMNLLCFNETHLWMSFFSGGDVKMKTDDQRDSGDGHSQDSQIPLEEDMPAAAAIMPFPRNISCSMSPSPPRGLQLNW